VLTNVSIREWSPDYQTKLEPRLAKLDRAKAKDWLLQQIPIAARSNAAPIQATYGPPLALIAQNLPELPRAGSVKLAAAVAHQALSANVGSRSKPDDVLQGSKKRSTSVRRTAQPLPSVIRSIDRKVGDLEKRGEVDRKAAIDAVVDVLPHVIREPIRGAFADAFVSDVSTKALDKLTAHVSRRLSGVLASHLGSDPVLDKASYHYVADLVKPSSLASSNTLTTFVQADPAYRIPLAAVRAREAALEESRRQREVAVAESRRQREVAVAESRRQFRESFVRGVRGGWVVTENPESRGKLFVHRTTGSDGTLTDLLYRVQVEEDGSWTVYAPPDSGDSGPFGKRLGSVEAPDVAIGTCNCIGNE
jgi:hypothetical protein